MQGGVIARIREWWALRQRERALRAPTTVPVWDPRPSAPRQRVRQAWCFLWRHKTRSVIEDEGDGHPWVYETCSRCGFVLVECMTCSTETIEEG